MDHGSDTERGERAYRLLLLNGVLLAILALLVIIPPGQPVQAAFQPEAGDERPRGRYTLVGGRLGAGNTDAVWILDAVNQELVGVRWDASRGRIEGLGFRSLTDDLVVREGR